jgi:hypothetical protein
VSDLETREQLRARVKALTEQVAELAAQNIILRERVEGRRDFDLDSDELPALLRRQAE